MANNRKSSVNIDEVLGESDPFFPTKEEIEKAEEEDRKNLPKIHKVLREVRKEIADKANASNNSQERTLGVPVGDTLTGDNAIDGLNNQTDQDDDGEDLRPTKRQSFDFFLDQIQTLNKIDNRRRQNGKKPFNKSDYVRRALDEQLIKDGHIQS